MVFISKPTPDKLVIRDVPWRLALIFAALAALFIILSYANDQSGNWASTSFFFVVALVMLCIAAPFFSYRTIVLQNAPPNLEIRDSGLLKRGTVTHAIARGAKAELVVKLDSDRDEIFQSFFQNGSEKIELDMSSSLKKSSAQITTAINEWLAANRNA